MLQLDIRTQDRLPTRRDVLAGTQTAMLRAVRALYRVVHGNLSGRILRVHTGKLASSLKASVVTRGNEVAGIVGTDVFYGRVLNTGAKPHVIAATGGTFTRRGNRRRGPKVLRFQVHGQAVFMRRIQHPGVRPTLWREQSALEAEPAIRAAFQAELERQLGSA